MAGNKSGDSLDILKTEREREFMRTEANIVLSLD